MNELLRARLKGIQDALMSHHLATIPLPNAAKGDEREVLLREFLGKVFPPPYRFGCGAVTDADGRNSGQLDVIVEWPFFASFPAPLGTGRLYLAESVAFVISVKSNLSGQWKQVENEVQQLRPLRRHWRTHVALNPADMELNILGPTFSRIPYVVVGFKGYKTIETLREKLRGTPQDYRPDAALVIESGAYVSQWKAPEATGEEGLFGFCLDCSFFARNVLFAEPNFAQYVTGTDDQSQS